jgi:serine/threonine-protein phosphatase PGAM5
MAKRTIYLVRHGQHDVNHPEADEMGGGLTKLGVLQAQITAVRLRSLPVVAIHYSSLRRTTETASIIAHDHPDIPVRKTRLLWECIPFVPTAFADQFNRQYATEELSAGRFQAYRVFTRFFRRSLGADKSEIIVSHGNLIRYLVLRALGASPAGWTNLDICNCGITEIGIEEDGRMVLVSYNDTGHLPPDLRTMS